MILVCSKSFRGEDLSATFSGSFIVVVWGVAVLLDARTILIVTTFKVSSPFWPCLDGARTLSTILCTLQTIRWWQGLQPVLCVENNCNGRLFRIQEFALGCRVGFLVALSQFS